MRGRRLHRLLKVIALLRGPSSWNARRLAEHLGISRRNVYRDLSILEMAGVPYWYDPEHGEGGGYRIRNSFFFPVVGLTDQECIDLAVVTRLAEEQIIPCLNEVCLVRDKLFCSLPATQQALIAEVCELFDAQGAIPADPGHDHRLMRTIQQALATKRQIEGVCTSPDQARPRKVHLQPRRVFLCSHIWHLAAHDNQANRTELYRLSQLESVKILDKPVTVDPSFSLRDFLGNAWCVRRGDRDYSIEILFNMEAASMAAHCRWHHTQEQEWRPDGSLVLHLTVSGLDEVKYWVLGWGPRATVLRPKELADEIRRLAAETMERYGTR